MVDGRAVLRSRHVVTAFAAVMVLVFAACGSTAKTTASNRSGDTGTTVTDPTSGDSSGSGTGAKGSSDGTGNSGTSATGGSVAGGGPGGSGSSAGPSDAKGVTSRHVAARGPGITDTTIYVGVGYSSQAAAGDRAIGAAGAAPSYDTRNVFNAAIDYANKHGGFAGRQLKALYYDYNLTTDRNIQDQSSCDFYTHDNKTFVILAGSDILNTCAEKAGAIPLGSGSATAETFKKYPHLIDPQAIRLDRLGQVTTSGLYKGGYFTGKLGMVTWDEPNYRNAMTTGYLPAMSKLHIKPAQVAYIMVPQQIGALGDMTAAVRSAIAKFKALGIDHVIIQDGPAGVWAGTGLTFEWMNQAKSQRYYPRYGQNVYNSPGWSVLPSDQMDHALAIDQSDYDKSKDAGWHINQTREKCFKIQADAGYPVNSSNANDQVIAGIACDTAFFVQRLVNKMPTLSADAFIEAAGTLGSSFPSAIVYGTKLIPGRRDGGDLVRTEEYFDSCKCLKYKGPPYSPD